MPSKAAFGNAKSCCAPSWAGHRCTCHLLGTGQAPARIIVLPQEKKKETLIEARELSLRDNERHCQRDCQLLNLGFCLIGSVRELQPQQG